MLQKIKYKLPNTWLSKLFNNIYSEIEFKAISYYHDKKTTEEKIKNDLLERLKKSIPFIRLHSIGQVNIEKVEKAINELRLDKKYNIKDSRFTTSSGLKSQTYEIKIER